MSRTKTLPCLEHFMPTIALSESSTECWRPGKVNLNASTTQSTSVRRNSESEHLASSFVHSCGRQVSCASILALLFLKINAKMSLAMTTNLPCAHGKAGCNTKSFRPQARSAPRVARSSHVVKASVADMEMVPDSNRRTVMNLLLVGAIGLPVASLAGYACETQQLLFSSSSVILLLTLLVAQAFHLLLCTQGVSIWRPIAIV